MPKQPVSIHRACRRGDLETVRELVSADPALVDADDEYQWRPVFHAALRRRTKVVRFLMDAGADLGAHEGYVMHYAGEVTNNKKIVGMLVKAGALDAHVRPPDDLARQFLASVFLADAPRVGALLRLHPRLAFLTDGRGDSPIHHAARNGDTEIVRLLLENGANVNAVTDRLHTVLYCAGGHGHKDTVQLLLDHDVDVDAKFTEDNVTLLEWLAQWPKDRRFREISEMLVEHRGSG